MKKSELRRLLREAERQLAAKERRKKTSAKKAKAKAQAAAKKKAEPPKRPRLSISPDHMAMSRATRDRVADLTQRIYAAALPPPGVVPEGGVTIAMDAAIQRSSAYAAGALDQQIVFAGGWVNGWGMGYGPFAEGTMFLGYPYLSELAQRAEYRLIVETLAKEMTRKGIKIQSTKTADHSELARTAEGAAEETAQLKAKQKADQLKALREATGGTAQDRLPENVMEFRGGASENDDEDADDRLPEEDEDTDPPGQPQDELDQADAEMAQQADKVKELEDEFNRLCVMAVMKTMVEYDGFMGRSHLYFDLMSSATTPVSEDLDELKTDIGDGTDGPGKVDTTTKVAKGSLRGLQPVEALWCYPTSYNSNDPLRPDWYKPPMWFVMGKEVHTSRLLTFIGRPVPDLLKPAYSFGGLSLTQMCKAYVDNWLRTRQSVSDLVHSFTVWKLGTNLSEMLAPGGNVEMERRIQFFNNLRDNKGLMVTDKETEELENISASLTDLPDLQAQAQEQMASVSQLPLVKLTGITPAGLNATSEGEIETFDDTILALQEWFLRPRLDVVFRIAQINIWGSVDPDLTYSFNPLRSLDAKEEAEVDKLRAETDDIRISSGVIDSTEARTAVAANPDTPYKSLDLSKVIEPPMDASKLEGLANLHNSGESEGGEGDFSREAG